MAAGKAKRQNSGFSNSGFFVRDFLFRIFFRDFAPESIIQYILSFTFAVEVISVEIAMKRLINQSKKS